LPTRHIDVILTSSRDASKRTRRFLRELSYVVPNSIRVNRGRTSLSEVFDKARSLNASKVILVSTIKGNPSLILVFGTDKRLLHVLRIKGVTLSYDLRGEDSVTDLANAYTRGATFCIKESDCPFVTELLINLNYSLMDECDVYSFAKREDDICVLTFRNREGKLIPPIIRFCYDQSNDTIQRKWIEVIDKVVNG